eukprot:PLAT12691.2.p1 GENE.PLAT12691.2~~PLAT12691.2.p1  ORF type:complete len:434 (+),score=236.41 PLAT12691.2:467-1768(+)
MRSMLKARALKATLRLFRTFDSSGDREIQSAELLRGLRDMGYTLSSDQATELLQLLDEDGNSGVDIAEFVHAMRSDDWQLPAALARKCAAGGGAAAAAGGAAGSPRPLALATVDAEHVLSVLREAAARKQLRSTYRWLDEDKSGSVDPHDLRRRLSVMGFAMTDDTTKQVLARFDRDGDGRISFAEFAAVVDGASAAAASRLEKKEATSRTPLPSAHGHTSPASVPPLPLPLTGKVVDFPRPFKERKRPGTERLATSIHLFTPRSVKQERLGAVHDYDLPRGVHRFQHSPRHDTRHVVEPAEGTAFHAEDSSRLVSLKHIGYTQHAVPFEQKGERLRSYALARGRRQRQGVERVKRAYATEAAREAAVDDARLARIRKTRAEYHAMLAKLQVAEEKVHPASRPIRPLRPHMKHSWRVSHDVPLPAASTCTATS